MESFSAENASGYLKVALAAAHKAAKISRDLAKAIEESLTYPGEVRVTVLRETRSVSIAK